MDSDDVVNHLVIKGVKFSDRILGRGAYGTVFAVDYNNTTCAAKEIHSVLIDEDAPEDDRSKIKQDFLQECLQHSKLHHPNIVKMLGVYYQDQAAFLPVLVMELMEGNLTQLLENKHNIPMFLKLSILQDVSKGVSYLHRLNPPILHGDLSSNNVLLTTVTRLVAKISDFVVMKVVSPLSSEYRSKVPGNVYFMPAPRENVHHGLPLDVFSFGCVVCHVITQQWPDPLPSSVADDPMNGPTGKVTEVDRRKHYIDQISNESLKQLVIKCLDNVEERRPLISVVDKAITSVIKG